MYINVESDMYAGAVVYRYMICWQNGRDPKFLKWQEKFRAQILLHTAMWFFGDVWHTALNIKFAM
jgi:hypothetical protein